LGKDGGEIDLSRIAPAFAVPGEEVRWPLAVPWISRRPIRLIAADGAVRLDRGDTPTSVLVDGEPIDAGRGFSYEELAQGLVLLVGKRVVLLLHLVNAEVSHHPPRCGLVGESDAIVGLRREIVQVAEVATPILLRGETGTGKELVARALHQAGPRCGQPYLAINMAAVPPSLAPAELFGAAKGAFTGAERTREGYFSRADGGTLFLDEIGAAPPEVQPLLLRALDSGEIQPVGAEKPLKVDVRTIAATDADLEAKIAAGRFRAALLHRLSGCEIRLPPLRERREDLGRLLFHFLRQELGTFGESHRLDDPGPDVRPWVPAVLVARLAAASWPGNVRQLKNVARKLAMLGRGHAEIPLGPQVERLLAAAAEPPPSELPERVAGNVAIPPRKPTSYRSPQEITEEELLAALRANRWHPRSTAEQLGISRASLYVLIDACPRARKAADLGREEIEASSVRNGGRLAAMVDELEVSEEGLKRRMKQLGISRHPLAGTGGTD
ncbi:MAG: sigma-54-dependent Fis family transcriptional regulator, partial [bacterium]|nr:sigma-54-dependent Fis family transcriptional regulator [bacterium]